MRRPIVCVAALLLALPVPALSQSVFHSVQSANLPTAATLPRGGLLFEISHRFDTPVSQGASALWGLDGPVRNRIGITYAPSSRLMLGILRSNYQDNLELNAKARIHRGSFASLPLEVAVMGGVAWNTEPFVTASTKDNEGQQYAQLIVNTMLGDRFAVGVVPSVLRNTRIEEVDKRTAFVLGLNGQAYLADWISVLGEWVVSERRGDRTDDSGTFGVELETRGHFFKLVVTNQARLNPTQVLGGSNLGFRAHDLRLGFNITRLLSF